MWIRPTAGAIFQSSANIVCSKPGHYAKEYPNVFDIWMMTTQEKLELIPGLLALADVSGMPPSEDNSEPKIEEEVQKEEDFGNHSQWTVCLSGDDHLFLQSCQNAELHDPTL